jgi:predicted HAD superfamily Cof-like phosphohydrolase
MPTNFENVKLFMKTFGQEVKEYPDLPPEEVVDLRLDLINEEVGELCEAVERDDMTEIADALTDILYVTYGMGAALGIDLDKCFEEVQRSNMSKMGEDGKPMYREDGKVMKGPNYSPPNFLALLLAARFNESNE